MIIGLLGFIGSGKGTVAQSLVENYNFRQDSFAASLKDACSVIFDWPRHLLEGDTSESRVWREQRDEWWESKLNISNFTPRLALQLIGTDALRNHFNSDIWFLTLQNRYRKNPDQNVVISDVRFPNEIDFIKSVGGKLIWVQRGNLPEWYNVACAANAGNSYCSMIMKDEFKHVHFSEWAWVGSSVNDIIDNNGTLAQLKENINTVVGKYV